MLQAETQNTTVTASGRTGEICQKTGPYRCSTSPVVIVPIRKGTPFPAGPQIRHPQHPAYNLELRGHNNVSGTNDLISGF